MGYGATFGILGGMAPLAPLNPPMATCSDIFNVQRKIWHELCCKFTADSISENFFKNRPTFLKVMNEYRMARFIAHSIVSYALTELQAGPNFGTRPDPTR